MAISLSLSAYTRTSPEPQGWRRHARSDPQHKCHLRTEHHMVYHSTDGRVFEVRRLRCDGCGRRWQDVSEQNSAMAPPTLRQGTVVAPVVAPVEANF